MKASENRPDMPLGYPRTGRPSPPPGRDEWGGGGLVDRLSPAARFVHNRHACPPRMAGLAPVTKYWLNDQLVDAAAALVPVVDHGFTVGDGAFETIRVERGRPFALTRHLVRLRSSLAILGFEGPSDDVIRAGVAAVLAESGVDTSYARLRITVTSGSGTVGGPRSEHPTLAVTVTAVHPYPPTATLVTVPWVRNERSPLVGAKTTSYAESVTALTYAQAHGASEAVMADTRDRLSECTASNIFVVLAGQAITPTLACGALPGVTRDLVLVWGNTVMPVREGELPATVLNYAEEIFITSSMRGVQPVVRVDDRMLEIGPVTRAIAHEYNRLAKERLDP